MHQQTMRRITTAAGAITLALATGAAQAAYLATLLKDKGVITAEEYRQVTGAAPARSLPELLRAKGILTDADLTALGPQQHQTPQTTQAATAPPPTTTGQASARYLPGKGFTFTSADRAFRMSVGGRLQARYSLTDQQDTAKSPNVSKWELKRMKFWLSGYAYTKELTYLVQTDLTQGGSSKLLEHAYLNYRPIPELQLLAGQTKVPFGRQWLNSSGSQEFVDRSTASDMFRPGFDTGAKLHGDLFKSLLTYEIGGYGGGGQSTTRSSNKNAMAARITVNPFGPMPYSEGDLAQSSSPKLSLGADYYMNTLAATYNATSKADTLEANNVYLAGSSGWLGKGMGLFTTNENIDVKSFSVDTAFKWQGFSLQGEYLAGEADGRSSGKKLRAAGWYLQSGYFILPRTVELALRYSYVDPNRDQSGDLQSDTQGAISWYLNRHNLKLQADVTNSHIQHGSKPSTDDLLYRLQAQVLF